MKYRSILTLAVAFLALTALSSISYAQNVEQQYVTRWNVEPIVRLSVDRQYVINGVRCRIDEGQYKDHWLLGRPVGTVLGKTTWHINADSIPPGNYKATHDLRTPTGAEWIPGVIRVPQIARNTGRVGRVGRALSAPENWPQDQYPRIENDRGPVEFAWDRDNLYIRPSAGATNPVNLTIDAVPATPGVNLKNVVANGVTTVPWTQLFPAGPFTGQTLRYQISGANDWTDLLFAGSGRAIYFSANSVSSPAGSDDQGPPQPILDALFDMSGMDCRGFNISWNDIEPEGPDGDKRRFDWSPLKDARFQTKGMIYCNIDIWNLWAVRTKLEEKDPQRFWRLAKDFVHEAALKIGPLGIKYFSLGYNEPEMHWRTDKDNNFNQNLSQVAELVRQEIPGALVIAGKFSSGDAELIQKFYAHGFKDNFDVMDIHPYNNDCSTGTAMGEVVASCEALQDLGMPEKRVFLGEGWGPTRILHAVQRLQWDAPVSKEESDLTRQFYQNGYRSLVNARADYSPDWVLGAKYFTLNDNIGSTYWKQSRQPVYDANGNLQYYLIGGLRFDKDGNFETYFCNGGLIDFQGNPKGQWFFDFPPALPEVRLLATGGPEYVLPGEWHNIKVQVVNATPKPITDLHISMRDRSAKFQGAISAEPLQPCERVSLAPGEVWETSVRMRLDRGEPRKIRWSVELAYKYDGEQQYTDDVVPTEIREPVEVRTKSERVVLSGGEQQAVVTVRNNNTSPVECKLLSYKGSEFTATPSKKSIKLAPGQEISCNFTIKPGKMGAGVKQISLVEGSNTKLAVTQPMACPNANGKITVDGNPSDWPRETVKMGSIKFAKSISKGQRPPSDPFPEPPPINQPGVDNSASTEVSSQARYGANAAVAWDQSGLYLLAIVEDQTFTQEYTDIETWREDSIQIAFDPLSDGAFGHLPNGKLLYGYNPDDRELVLALTQVGPQVALVHAPHGVPIGLVEKAQLAVKRDGKSTIYEARIPWSVIPGFSAKAGAKLGFDILINNYENNDRYSLGWADGIGPGKYPSRYVPVTLN